MATLTIRNLPDVLHERLKRHAERHRRSLNSEAIVLLERALEQAPAERAEVRERLRALRSEVPPLTLDPEELKRARREGLL